MFKKLLEGVPILTLLLVVFLILGNGKTFGAGNGSTSHTNSQFDAAGGFSVGGTVAVDSAGRLTGVVSTTASTVNGNEAITGTLTVGGGTAVIKAQCNAVAKSIGSLAANATTTFDLSLPGASSSQNQGYFIGNASSSIVNGLLRLSVAPSSTTGIVEVLAQNLGGATYGGSTTTISACYLQF